MTMPPTMFASEEGDELSDELLTPKEVATWLGVTSDTIYRWLRKGELPAIKLGRLYRIPKAEVLALVTRHGLGDEEAD